jgi:adenylate cyclase
MTTARESALQKDVLKAYFSPKIIDQIMKSPDVFSMEGSGQEVTVLFSDIVGFTSLSDNMHPAAVQHVLSDYMEAMTDAIFTHNGAVDKFMGDGIMAFWGYPEPEGADAVENLRLSASDAVKAAIAMQGKMKELNEKWAREGRKTLNIRIGINTGYVTLGNMGSKHRLEFTLIGKNVNLAQRLEGAAPGGGILVSDRTYSLVKDEVKAEKMPGLTLAGFGEEVHAYVIEW